MRDNLALRQPTSTPFSSLTRQDLIKGLAHDGSSHNMGSPSSEAGHALPASFTTVQHHIQSHIAHANRKHGEVDVFAEISGKFSNRRLREEPHLERKMAEGLQLDAFHNLDYELTKSKKEVEKLDQKIEKLETQKEEAEQKAHAVENNFLDITRLYKDLKREHAYLAQCREIERSPEEVVTIKRLRKEIAFLGEQREELAVENLDLKREILEGDDIADELEDRVEELEKQLAHLKTTNKVLGEIIGDRRLPLLEYLRNSQIECTRLGKLHNWDSEVIARLEACIKVNQDLERRMGKFLLSTRKERDQLLACIHGLKTICEREMAGWEGKGRDWEIMRKPSTAVVIELLKTIEMYEDRLRCYAREEAKKRKELDEEAGEDRT